MTDLGAKLLWELQQGLPLVSDPFRVVAERLGMSVAEVLTHIGHS